MNVCLVFTLVVLMAAAGTVQASDRCWYRHVTSRWFMLYYGYHNLAWYPYRMNIYTLRLRDCTHGQWSEWERASVGACSEECGTGTREVLRERKCTNPAPSNGGNKCSGSCGEVFNENCNEQECPVDGGWSDWSEWRSRAGEECSVLCGGGLVKHNRLRRCSDPKPQHGGKDCVGENRENRTIACNTEYCGEQCQEGHVTYIAHQSRAGRFYHCDNGVARLRRCRENTQWNQEAKTCGHAAQEEDSTVITDCKASNKGILPHPTDCGKFLQCVHDKAVVTSCPAGLHFSEDNMVCMRPANAGCDDGSSIPVEEDSTAIADCKTSTKSLLPHPTDCGRFLQCVHGNPVLKSCPAGLHFSEDNMVCMRPADAGCDNESETAA